MWLKILLSSVVAGIVGWGGAFITGSSGQVPMNKTQAGVAVVTGVLAAAKDIQAYVTRPPQT